jgi:hypothetical protein
MPIELAGVFDRDGFVEVVLKGPYTTAEFPWAFQQVLQATERPHGTRLLLNLRDVEGMPTTLDRFEFGREASRTLPRTVKMAFFAGATLLDPDRFGERVARNRGLWVRAFLDPAQAVEWLFGDDDPPPPV